MKIERDRLSLKERGEAEKGLSRIPPPSGHPRAAAR